MKSKTLFLLTAAIGLAVPALRAADPAIVVQAGGSTTTTQTTVGVYETLPPDYDGEYYQSDKHYYYGGKYEKGHFKNEGHEYEGRYSHNGKYIYGGKFDEGHRHHKEHKD
jgi:hypothetical protein